MIRPLPRVSKKGFDLTGEGAQILLLHGYTGSPYDLRPLSDDLNARGFHVVVPLLAGHGTKAEKVHGVQVDDWINEAIAAYEKFDQSRPIVMGGLSMGALLAMMLSQKSRQASALLLFSPSLELNLSAVMTIALANLGLIDKRTSFKKLSGGSDILDPIAKKKSPSYKEMPISGLLELEKLRLMVKQHVTEIGCPIFVAFGGMDSAIDVDGSHRWVLERSAGPIFSKIYPNSKHIVTLDYDRELLFADVGQFLAKHLGIQS